MRHVETESYHPLDESPPFKKTKRHRGRPERSGEGRRRPKIRLPHVNSFKKEFKSLGSLISRFVSKRGPQAVVRRVIREFGPRAVSSDFESDPRREEITRVASVIAFERLYHSSLNETVGRESAGEKRVLDSGSTSGMFQSLRHADGTIEFVPDGVVVSNSPPETTLFGLCEYFVPGKTIGKLKTQVRQMLKFIDIFSGKNLGEIKVYDKPKIYIVIPSDSLLKKERVSKDPRVTMHVAPFPREFPERLAIACLRDLGKLSLQT